jgi:uncharacterized protein
MPLFLALAIAAVAPPAGPAFDCRRAALPVERMICADPRLAAYDRAIAALYRTELAKRRRAGAAPAQKAWLAERNLCASPGCVLERHRERFLDLAAAGNMNAQALRRREDPDSSLEIAPVGGGWFMFYATDLWVYPGGSNANTAESGGVFRLAGNRGEFEGGAGCTILFQPLPGRRWQLTEAGKGAGMPCGGGLNTSLSGVYGPEK